ncbi:hypothetical protein ACLB2K_027264 [Fragaria x ananassa]
MSPPPHSALQSIPTFQRQRKFAMLLLFFSKVNRKNGLWAVKAQNGCVFSEIMEEIHDLRMQSSLSRIIDVGVGHIDQEMGTNMSDSESKQVSGAEGDARNETRPLVTVVVDFTKFIHSMGDGPCYPSNMSYQTHSHAFNATNVEIEIGNVVELHEPEAVVKHGFISGKEGPCSDSIILCSR